MLVLVVGGIPIAMPTVLSVTLALGASALAAEGAIVARMSAVEEMAGTDVLCSDKTGDCLGFFSSFFFCEAQRLRVKAVTLALGASALAGEGAIVARMSAVKEMAGTDVLCSDKTSDSLEFSKAQGLFSVNPP